MNNMELKLTVYNFIKINGIDIDDLLIGLNKKQAKKN